MYDLMGKAAGVLHIRTKASIVGRSSSLDSEHPSGPYGQRRAGLRAPGTPVDEVPSVFENVIDQTEAMQAVAPEGFKIHYDFTMHGTQDHMPSLLDRLSEYEIAGCFEDPLPGEDLDGYRELKLRSKRPIVLHHFPMGATYEVLGRPADAYMLGHS